MEGDSMSLMRTRPRRVLFGVLVLLGGSGVGALASAQPAMSLASSVTLYVSAGSTGTACTFAHQCGSVSQAVTAATGGSYIGDDMTIQVAPGTYSGGIGGSADSFSSLGSLTIEGQAPSDTIIDGGGGLTIQGAGIDLPVTVRGLTLEDLGGTWIDDSGIVTIDDDYFYNNTSGVEGGGVSTYAGTVTIDDDTFDHNTANGDGGAIFAWGGNVMIANDTFNDNSGIAGGAVAAENTASATLINDTLANDSGKNFFGNGLYGLVTVSNSILAGGDTCGGPVGDGGYNVEANSAYGYAGDDTCEFASNPTNVVLPSTAPLNGLADSPAANGSSGPPTFAVAPGNATTSPAFEEVPASACTLTTDERGASRPGIAGQNCDAGAYEYIPGMEIPAAALFSATVGQHYSFQLEALGGVSPYKWKKTTALPKSLKLSKSGLL
jgi:hypothetical protein